METPADQVEIQYYMNQRDKQNFNVSGKQDLPAVASRRIINRRWYKKRLAYLSLWLRREPSDGLT